MRVELESQAAILAAAEDQLEPARVHFQAALDVARAEPDTDPLVLAKAYINASTSLMALGRLGEARAAAEQGRALARQHLGASHPEVARTELSLAQILMAEGKYVDARPYVASAIASYQAALGPDSPQLAIAFDELGNVEAGLDHDQGALDLYRRALAILQREQASGELVIVHTHLGDVLSRLDKADSALAEYQTATAIEVALHGPESTMRAALENNQAVLLGELGRLDEARAAYERALALNRKLRGAEHRAVGLNLFGIAEIDAQQRGAAAALPTFARACPLLAAGDPLDRAICEGEWARALWPSDKARALELAHGARTVLAASGGRAHDQLAELDRWLAAHHG
jgi:tetratricopeptide (TPR) repeat protein